MPFCRYGCATSSASRTSSHKTGGYDKCLMDGHQKGSPCWRHKRTLGNIQENSVTVQGQAL